MGLNSPIESDFNFLILFFCTVPPKIYGVLLNSTRVCIYFTKEVVENQWPEISVSDFDVTTLLTYSYLVCGPMLHMAVRGLLVLVVHLQVYKILNIFRPDSSLLVRSILNEKFSALRNVSRDLITCQQRCFNGPTTTLTATATTTMTATAMDTTTTTARAEKAATA
jgi:hypothetical protein